MQGVVSWPIPASERVAFVYLERARLGRDGHALVAEMDGKSHAQIPVGRTSAIMLGPGSSMTHEAARLCAEEGALVLWVGEHGVRMYASGNPRADAAALLRQAKARIDPRKRLAGAREIWRRMFGAEPAVNRSIEQLRGEEGAKVRALLPKIAKDFGIAWEKRDGSSKDPVNQAINVANSALYGLCEAVILALGYSPAIGLIHDGDARSFVFDVADTVKFTTVVPLAMRLAAESGMDVGGRVRLACRDLFYERRMASSLVDVVEGVFDAADRA